MYKHFPIFDLAVKWVKDNPRSVFEQSWLYLGTRCCIPSFIAIGQLVLEKIFKSFTIYGRFEHILFTPTLKATNEMWLHAKLFLERCLKLSNYVKSWIKGETMT